MDDTEFWKEAHAMKQGQSCYKVMVKDLQATTLTTSDAWDRTSIVPIRIDLLVGLLQPESIAVGRTDELDGSTVNYADLSVAALETVKEESSGVHGSRLARHILTRTQARLSLNYDFFLATVTYPKDTLQGDGISYTVIDGQVASFGYNAMILVKNVKIPTLIGLLDFEREAKQMVVATLWLAFSAEAQASLNHTHLERIMVNTIGNAQCRTLEALANTTLKAILEPPYGVRFAPGSVVARLRLHKPIAVPLAQSSAVEISRRVDFGP